MATQTMGQLYCSSAFGRKWNRAWERAWSEVSTPVADATVDQLPQDLFDSMLAHAFWLTAADVSPRVLANAEDLCTVPDKPAISYDKLRAGLLAWRQAQG